MTLNVYVSGQRSFGAAVADLVTARGHTLVGVASPAYRGTDASLPWAYGDDALPWDRLREAAWRHGVPWTESSQLRAALVPDGTDVIIAAHSHAFIGAATRRRARLASVGYHPSLLPLHRGRDAVRWTIRDGDRVTGGSVYHLTAAVDAGPLAAQDYVLVPPGATASTLWRDLLFPLGVRLLGEVLDDIDAGDVTAVPQDEVCATWEPSWDRPPLHRPELPELPAAGGSGTGLRWTADRGALRHRREVSARGAAGAVR
ncbi:formyltransferase family protein [Actinomadura opuntiae]|uniref:formyltransferase family protein n=1 Tax=Actinomadura sp. OS1-43 TaxID=604315 RepID=UPI00255AE9C3|nr:formyltransferase family protein [Actinomadura sp. OS1-43]MDL4812793.1 formyltransferase family protein [Actinomadura sp. OS1-43]